MIFFDIDRTLFDYDRAVDRAMEDFYTQFSLDLDLTLEAFKEKWVELYEQFWPQYELGTLSLKDQRILRMQGLFPGRQISTVQAEKYARFHNEAYISHRRLFPDAVLVLDRLKDRKLGVISNGNVERQRAKLDRMGIIERFDVIVISAAHACAKPDRRIFETACNLGGVNPGSATHVGDNLAADIAGAAGAGLRPVWVRRGPGEAPTGIATVDNLNEILPILA